MVQRSPHPCVQRDGQSSYEMHSVVATAAQNMFALRSIDIDESCAEPSSRVGDHGKSRTLSEVESASVPLRCEKLDDGTLRR